MITQKINIKSLRIGLTESGHGSLDERSIYIECEEDLTQVQKSGLEESNIGTPSSLFVSIKAESTNYTNAEGNFKTSCAHLP